MCEPAVVLYPNIQSCRVFPVSNVVLVPLRPSDVTAACLVEQMQLSRQASETLCHAHFRAEHGLDHSTVPRSSQGRARSSQGRAPNVHFIVTRSFGGRIGNPCLGMFPVGPGGKVGVVQLHDVSLRILVIHHPRPIHHSACKAERCVIDSRCVQTYVGTSPYKLPLSVVADETLTSSPFRRRILATI